MALVVFPTICTAPSHSAQVPPGEYAMELNITFRNWMRKAGEKKPAYLLVSYKCYKPSVLAYNT